MRSHCEALIRQLRSGSPSKQHQAVAALLSSKPLTSRDWLSAVGAVPHLLRLLHSPSTTDPQARAIQRFLQYNISASTVYLRIGEHDEAAPDDVIPALVAILRQDDVAECSVVAYCLATLAINASNKLKIMEAGAVEDFVQLLESNAEGFAVDIQYAASCGLVHLSQDHAASQARIAAAGAIAPLIHMLRTASSEKLQAQAAKALANLASNDARPVVEAGAIPVLVRRLTDGSTQAQEMASDALQTITKDFDSHTEVLASAPLLPLVRTLASGSDRAQEHALQALLRLSNHPAFPKQFADAGAAPPLMHLLHSASGLTQRRAATLFGIMVTLGWLDVASIQSVSTQPPPSHLQAAASSAGMQLGTEMQLRALTPPIDDQEAGSPSAPPSTAASVHPASASASTAAAASAHKELPLRPRKSCWSCGATGVPLKKCSVCSVAAYCGADCQKTDWRVHKGQCAGLMAGATSSAAGSSSAAGEK